MNVCKWPSFFSWCQLIDHSCCWHLCMKKPKTHTLHKRDHEKLLFCVIELELWAFVIYIRYKKGLFCTISHSPPLPSFKNPYSLPLSNLKCLLKSQASERRCSRCKTSFHFLVDEWILSTMKKQRPLFFTCVVNPKKLKNNSFSCFHFYVYNCRLIGLISTPPSPLYILSLTLCVLFGFKNGHFHPFIQ